MRTRSGVSLIEVIVATVLLAVGIIGCIGSLIASARLREEARTQETLAAALLDRLVWVERVACDSTTVSGGAHGPDGTRVDWTLGALDGARPVEISATVVRAGRPRSSALTTRVPCP